MPKIEPFTAYLPDQEWLNNMLASSGSDVDPLEAVQKLLEPQTMEPQAPPGLEKYIGNMGTLLYSKCYSQADAPAMYLYEQESASGTQFGIWAMTSLAGLKDGSIIRHEETLPAHRENLQAYREHVGLEGSPILLTYARQADVAALIEKIGAQEPRLNFKYKDRHHRLWCIAAPSMIAALQKAFGRVQFSYVADGHHRLSAAEALHRDNLQWVSTLYVTTGQLRCREFHRMVRSPAETDEVKFFEHLRRYWFISGTPDNHVFRPGKLHQFGLSFRGKWYRLDLRPGLLQMQEKPDVSILQDEVLGPFFGISDPRTDGRLISWPADQWQQMLQYSGQHSDAIIFTLHPVTARQLIGIADNHISLPPKSTYIEPKVPYGLLICNHKIKEPIKTEPSYA